MIDKGRLWDRISNELGVKVRNERPYEVNLILAMWVRRKRAGETHLFVDCEQYIVKKKCKSGDCVQMKSSVSKLSLTSVRT